jgi:hypothetical protein
MELSGTANDVIGGEWTLRATALSFSDDDGAGFTSKYALRPLTRTVSLESRFRLPVEFSLWARLSNSRRHGEDPWTLADVRIAFERRGITVYADGTNLTDADFLDVSAKRAAGRALHLGARLTR